MTMIIKRRERRATGGLGGPVIDGGEQTGFGSNGGHGRCEGATATLDNPIVIGRDTTNSSHFTNSPNTLKARIAAQYDKINKFREDVLKGVATVNVDEWFVGLMKAKPEIALNFLGKMMPRDMDVTQGDVAERQPIIIIQHVAGNVNLENSPQNLGG